MSEMVESFRESAAEAKEARRISWEARGVAIAQIVEAGYLVITMGKDEMHYRIKLAPGRGYVDFWPSTWRWHHKMKHAPRPIHHGHGLQPMLTYLKGCSDPVAAPTLADVRPSEVSDVVLSLTRSPKG